MTDTDRNIGHRWFEEVWNKGRRDAIAEMIVPDAVLHDGGVDSNGLDGFHEFFDRMGAAFSELKVTVHDTIAEGDRVCVRWSCRARHTGDGLGVAATGNPIEVTGILILRVSGGRVVEGWQNWDMLALLNQIQTLQHPKTYLSAS